MKVKVMKPTEILFQSKGFEFDGAKVILFYGNGKGCWIC